MHMKAILGISFLPSLGTMNASRSGYRCGAVYLGGCMTMLRSRLSLYPDPLSVIYKLNSKWPTSSVRTPITYLRPDQGDKTQKVTSASDETSFETSFQYTTGGPLPQFFSRGILA